MSCGAGPVAATIAVVARDNTVLLVRRANPPDQGRWGFPGGKIERGETLAQAALRELLEETGVRAQACEVLTALDVFARHDDGALRQHFVLIAVLCRWVGGEPVAADDALDAAWFDVASLTDEDPTLSRDVARVARKALAVGAIR